MKKRKAKAVPKIVYFKAINSALDFFNEIHFESSRVEMMDAITGAIAQLRGVFDNAEIRRTKKLQKHLEKLHLEITERQRDLTEELSSAFDEWLR